MSEHATLVMLRSHAALLRRVVRDGPWLRAGAAMELIAMADDLDAIAAPRAPEGDEKLLQEVLAWAETCDCITTEMGPGAAPRIRKRIKAALRRAERA